MKLRSLALPAFLLTSLAAYASGCGGDSGSSGNDGDSGINTTDGGSLPSADGGGGGKDAGSPDVDAATLGAPTDVVATGGLARAAQLTWKAPTETGKSAIKSYTITASPGGATLVSTGLSATFEGLTAGTAYTFVVHATNAEGYGPDSKPSAPYTPEAGLTMAAGFAGCSGTGKVTLLLPPVVGASSYNVYFGTSPGVTRANGTKIANVTTPYV